MSGQSIQYRYSAAFKQKVIAEIESGHLTISQAKKVYDIRGGGTIHLWLKRYGKNHLLNKVVRIEMKDEKDKLKELAAKNRELESALAQTQLKLLYAESLLASVETHYGIDVKKLLVRRHPQRASRRPPATTRIFLEGTLSGLRAHAAGVLSALARDDAARVRRASAVG